MTALAACAAEGETGRPAEGGPRDVDAKPTEGAPLSLCARDRDDAVRDVFCVEDAPPVRSLLDLQERLRLAPDSPVSEAMVNLLGIRPLLHPARPLDVRYRAISSRRSTRV